jgi:beta-lactamase regulating signal transducer with metallopeptidase domain
MTLATPANDMSLLSAFTWSLLQFIWQGAFLAMVLAVGLKISKRSSPRLKYGICCIALAAMALCPVFTCARFELARPVISGYGHIVSTGSATLLGVGQEPIHNQLASLISWTDRHILAILALWAIGVLLFYARILVSIVKAHRLTAGSLDAVPDALQSLTNLLASRLKLVVPPRLVCCNQVTAPSVVGWRKPVILLPSSSLASLSVQQTETILAHELAHIRRGDYLVNLLQAAVEALLFYHPAIGWVSRHIRREREHCCDDLALSVTGSALAYAKALTVLEEQRSPAQIEFSLGTSGGDLSMRIKRLFEKKETARSNRGAAISIASLGALTLAALAVLSISAIDRVSAQPADPAIQGQHGAVTTTKGQSPPDMSCTYYQAKSQTRPSPHPGVCDGSILNPATYYCRQLDGLQLAQSQIACGQKVKRYLAWEREHGKNQSGKNSTGDHQ